MKKATLVVTKPYQNGKIFDPEGPLNRDNCLAVFREIKALFAARGWDLQTQDLNPMENSEIVIYNEMPPKQLPRTGQQKFILILIEHELIIPTNWELDRHENFDLIFTWHEDYMGRGKYRKLNQTHSGRLPFVPFAQKKKFATLIAGNKKHSHPQELYSKRKEVIDWFEKNHPDEFTFYGMGWDQFTFTGPLPIRALNRVPFLRRLLAKKYKTYGGPVGSKLETYSDYKYSFCYENARGFPGYITEKIFDSLCAGCVPVYWGPDNVAESIPESCFIDRRQFKDYQEVYEYLKSITPERYQQYQDSIGKYLDSPQILPFTPAYSAKVFVQGIAESGIYPGF